MSSSTIHNSKPTRLPIAQHSLQLRLFGAPTIRIQNRPVEGLPAKGLALLAYLALNQPIQQRSTVAHLLWDGISEDKALANLRKMLQKVRAEMPEHLIVGRNSVSLSPDVGMWVDALAFEAEVESALAANDPITLEQALRHYHQDFLAGFYLRKAPEFETWQLSQQALLRETMVKALKQLSQSYSASGELTKAIDVTRQVLQHEPWREEAHRQLMRLLYQNGETAQALLHYEMCRQLLDQELGVPPSGATEELCKQIRAGKVEPLLPYDEAVRAPRSTPRSTGKESGGFSIPHRLAIHVELRADKQLFGIASAQDALLVRLEHQSRPWLIAIDGIGGIGKTALAQELLASLSTSSYFGQMAWISAKQEEFESLESTHSRNTLSPSTQSSSTKSSNSESLTAEEVAATQPLAGTTMDAEQLVDAILVQLATTEQVDLVSNAASKETLLRQLLTEKPTLVVIDNLETVADYMALLPTLRSLSNPSKFLLTSRYSLSNVEDVFSQTLDELSRQDALELLRHEATMRGIRGLADAAQETLGQIYTVVGGHPLALNLILGQLNFLPMEHVLDGLQQTTSQRAEELYTHIYWQSWNLLDQPSRHLFCAMPLMHNATYAQLSAITGLAENSLQRCITQLIRLSLLRVDGDLFEPRYGLHRLTETFLNNAVLNRLYSGLHGGLQSGLHSALHNDCVEHQVDTFSPGDAVACRDFYQQTIVNGLRYWHDNPIVRNVEVEKLDRNHESILTLLSHGLRYELAWTHARELIVKLASYMERRGHWRAWRAILDQAIETAQNTNDLDGETTITALLGRLSQRQGRDDEVVRHYRRVVRLAKSQNNRHESARAYSNLGYHYIARKLWWRSEQLSLRALEIFEEIGSNHGLAHTCNHLGMLYTRMERWDQAQDYFEKACKLWQSSGDQHSLLSGEINLGLLYVEVDNPEEAIKRLQIAYQIAQQTGELSFTARIWNNLAAAHQKNRAWREAEECAKKAEALFQEYTDERGLASAWENLGIIYGDMNQKKRATEHFSNALTIHHKFKNRTDINRIHAMMSAL